MMLMFTPIGGKENQYDHPNLHIDIVVFLVHLLSLSNDIEAGHSLLIWT